MKIVIAVITGVIVGAAGFSLAPHNSWNCAAEDEVLIINDTCVHIDTIENENTK